MHIALLDAIGDAALLPGLLNGSSTDVAELPLGRVRHADGLERIVVLRVDVVEHHADLSRLLAVSDGLLSRNWLDHRRRADTLAVLVQAEVAVLVVVHWLLPLDRTLVLVLFLVLLAVVHRELAIVADDIFGR